MNIEEKAIIKEAQSGSIVAFEALVKKYDTMVLQIAFSMVNNTQDAEDIYQEVFVRVFNNLQRFKFKSEFSTWLYRIVINYCINYQKKKKRTQLVSIDEEEQEQKKNWYQTIKNDEINPEESVLNQELSKKIETAMESLTPKQKTVFVLRHFYDKKLKNIAVIMNCSEGTIKNSLFRATQKMQHCLRNYSRE